YTNVDQVNFFANAINTRTHGIDAVIHGRWNMHKAQLIAILAANVTQTRLFGDIKTPSNLSATSVPKNTLFNEEQRKQIEKGRPRNKIILSLDYKRGMLGFMLRNTRFAKTTDNNTDRPQETFSSKILTDVSVSYHPKAWFTLTAGANNLFDVYPDRIKNDINTSDGRLIYAVNASPFGFMGGNS